MSAQLFAGAAKACITPPTELFPMYHKANAIAGTGDYFFTGVLDDVYVRVSVMQAGDTRAVIAVFDSPGVPALVEEMYEIIEDAAKVPHENIILTCTHDHNNLFTDNVRTINSRDEEFKEKMLKVIALQKKALRQAVEEAVAGLQPAKVGMGIGKSYLNVNRHVDLENGLYSIGGFELDKPSDRDLAVIRIDSLDGKPISILFNYAAHASLMTNCDAHGTGTEITADIGLSCTKIEKMWNDEPVAIFTSGAAGDQNMVMLSRVYDVMPDGTTPMHDFDKPVGHIILDFMSGLLARDVNKVTKGIDRFHSETRLWTEKRNVTVPKEAFPDRGARAKDEVLELTLFMIGNFAIVASNGEIYTEIGMRMKEGAPYKNVMYITQEGHRIGYIRQADGTGLFEKMLKENVYDMMDDYGNKS